MVDRLIDLNTLLQLIVSRSDYLRIARNCLLNPESGSAAALNRTCDADENDSVELCPATQAASELYSLVISHLRGGCKEDSIKVQCFLNPDAIVKYPSQAIRCLLCLPCWSQTPWDIVKSLVLYLQDRCVHNGDYRQHLDQTKTSDVETLADLEIDLKQLDKNNSRSTNIIASHDILVEIELFLSTCHLESPNKQMFSEGVLNQCEDLFYSIITKPTRSSIHQFQPNYTVENEIELDRNNVMYPLHLLPCILETVSRLEDSLYLGNMSSVPQKRQRCSKLMDQLIPTVETCWIAIPEIILPLLLCISRLGDKMSSNIHTDLKFLLKRILVECPKLWKIPIVDVGEIIRIITQLFSYQKDLSPEHGGIKGDTNLDRQITWEDLLLQVYDFSSHKYALSDLYEIESIMMASFSRISLHKRNKLILNVSKECEDTISPSVRARMLLVILQSEQRRSDIVHKLIDEDIATQSNLVINAFNGFLLLICDDVSEWQQTFDTVDSAINCLQSMFHGVSYAGEGIIRCNGGDHRHRAFFSDVSHLIYSSLIYNTRSMRLESAGHYADMWLNTVTRFLYNLSRMKLCFGHMVIAISAILIIVHECPEIKSDFVMKYIVPALSAKYEPQQNEILRSLYIIIITAVLSCTNIGSEFLNSAFIMPLIGVLQVSIDEGDAIFAMKLASSMSHCIAGREAVGNLMKDYFDKSSIRCIYSRLKNIFEIMFVLLESELDLDHVTIFVTGKITKFIVCSEPSAPYQLRCEVLLRLSCAMATERMNKWTRESLIHSVLYKISYFFHVEELKGCRKLQVGSFVIPVDLIFTPHSHHLYLYEELIYLIKIICVSFVETSETDTDHRWVDAGDAMSSTFLVTLFNYIHNPSEGSDSDVELLRLMDDTKIIASLYLKGIINALFENDRTPGKGRSTVLIAEYSNFQEFLVESEKETWEKLSSHICASVLEEPWWINHVGGTNTSLYVDAGIISKNAGIDSTRITCSDEINLFWNRLCSLFITSFFSIFSTEYIDDEARISDSQLQLICSISILLGRYSLSLGSNLQLSLSDGDERSPFTVVSLDSAKKIFLISCMLCRNHTQLSVLSDYAFAALHHIFRMILVLSVLLKDIKDKTKSLDLDAITSVWDFYYIFISDEQHADLIELFSSREQCLTSALSGTKTRNDPNTFIHLTSKRLLVALQSLVSIKLVMGRDGLPFFVHVITTLCEFLRIRLRSRCEGQEAHSYDQSNILLIECVRKLCENIEESNLHYISTDANSWAILRANLLDSVFALWSTLCDNHALFLSSMEKTIFLTSYELPKLICQVDRTFLRFPLTNSSVTDEEQEQSEYLPLAMALGHLSSSTDMNSETALFYFLQNSRHFRKFSPATNDTKSLRLNFQLLSLDVIDSYLLDTLRMITSDSEPVTMCSRRLVVYSCRTVELLSVIINALMCVLQPRPDKNEIRQVSPDVAAWSLTPKKKCCSCIEHLLAAVSHSMRLLRSVLKNFNGENDRNIVFKDPRIGDAAALLIVWFHPTFDAFVSNIERWHQVEASTTDNKEKCGVGITNDIEKLFQLLEGLELERSKLLKILRKLGNQQAAVTSVGFILGSLATHTQLQVQDIPTIFSRRLQTNNSDYYRSNIGPSTSSVKRKRAQERFGRNCIRSSNPLVNEWLNLDQSLIEKGEGGRKDVFEDLDDFLVDG